MEEIEEVMRKKISQYWTHSENGGGRESLLLSPTSCLASFFFFSVVVHNSVTIEANPNPWLTLFPFSSQNTLPALHYLLGALTAILLCLA